MDFVIYHDERLRGGKYVVYYYHGWTLFVCESCPPLDVQMQLFYKFAEPYYEVKTERMPYREMLRRLGEGPSPERMLWLCWYSFKAGNGIIKFGAFIISRFPTSGNKCYGLCISFDQQNIMHLTKLEPNIPEELVDKKTVDKVEYIVCDRCDIQSLSMLLTAWRPKAVIPIHPERDAELVEQVSKTKPVVVLPDEQKIAPIGQTSWDAPDATLVLMDADRGDFEEVKNPNHEPWGTIREITLGDFKNWEAATAILQWVRFDTTHLLGYSIYEEEDFTPFASRSFRPDMSVIATTPAGVGKGEGDLLPFPSGDKVWMISDFDAVVPCEIISMPSEEDKQNNYFHGCSRKWKNYQKHLCSWAQDVVLVRPLVLLKSNSKPYFKMHDVELVQRTQLYPYRTFPPAPTKE
jgi:hypothetical protein